MRTKLALLLTVAMFAVPAVSAASGDEVATGHIEAGSPHTLALSASATTGQEGIDAFLFDASSVAGKTVETSTVDNGGHGYDVNVYWYAEDHSYLGACQSPAADETCQVPSEAAEGEVTAAHGVDLDVTILEG